MNPGLPLHYYNPKEEEEKFKSLKRLKFKVVEKYRRYNKLPFIYPTGRMDLHQKKVPWYKSNL